MTRKTYNHGLDKEAARSLLERAAQPYVAKYGLSAGWRADTWTGKRVGVQITARVSDEHLTVEVKALIGEKKILSAIDKKLRKRLP